MTPAVSREVAIVLKGYPRLSETFVAQEILGLQRGGLPLRLYSLRHPTDKALHPVHREITADVTYLPEYLKDERARVLSAWRAVRHLPGYRQAFRLFLADFKRDRTANRLRRFGQACVLAHEMPPSISRIYAHFLHTPASVARYAAVMRALPWCASAHAKDIWTSPEWEIREKLEEIDWLVTCTATNRDHLRKLAVVPERVDLLYHGLDFTRFPTARRLDRHADGKSESAEVRILSVGRAVAKKGYDDLLRALAALPAGLHWHFTHIGGGMLIADLKSLSKKLGLEGRITWLGAQSQERVLAAYREADLFVLASRIAEDGDRDGLPNVLMEAQSQALTCLASDVSGISELIVHNETGILVPPENTEAFSQALAALIADPKKRQRLANAGYQRVRKDFSMTSGIEALLMRFQEDTALKAAE